MSNPKIAKFLCDAAGLFYLAKKLCALGFRTHRRTSTRRRPDRCDKRSNDQIFFRNLCRDPFQLIVRRINPDVRIEKKKIDSIKLNTTDRCTRREIEHRIKADDGLGSRRTLANKSGPECVVQIGKLMRWILESCHGFELMFGACGLTCGPKYRKTTRSSVALVFSYVTPRSAAGSVTKTSSSVIS